MGELRYNREVYQQVVTEAVTPTTRWLDAGCGWHAFPAWPDYPDWELQAERGVVGCARLLVGCDLDPQIAKHRTFRHVVRADLASLPFRNASFTLVTVSMVVEHLDIPTVVFEEVARVILPGGQVLFHTPNALGYFALSHFLPRHLKLRVLKWLGDDRPDADVFPTKYRANTRGRLRRSMAKAGLVEDWCDMRTGIPNLPSKWKVLYRLEESILRILATRPGRPFRASVLAQFHKPDHRASIRTPSLGGQQSRIIARSGLDTRVS